MYNPFKIKGGEIGIDHSSGENSSISSVCKYVSSSARSGKKWSNDDNTATTSSGTTKKNSRREHLHDVLRRINLPRQKILTPPSKM